MLPLISTLLLSCAPQATVTRPGRITASVQAYTFEGAYDLFGGLKVNAYRMNNGLSLLVVQDPSAPVVAYQSWYRVGSAVEEDGSTGLAHLFEHMMFKETEAYGPKHFDETLEKAGAKGKNAWTWLDQTVYIQSVPKAALNTVADLEATRMHRLVLSDEAFTTERDVVISERRYRVDNSPDGTMDELLWDMAFREHPYGMPTIGWMKDLEGLDPEEARSFYDTWYAPNNTTVIVVGDINPDEAAGVVSGAYAQVQHSELPPVEFEAEPEQTAQRRMVKALPMATDRLMVGFRSPAYSHADTPAFEVLDAVLTAGQSGLLSRALEHSGLAAEVSSSLPPLRDEGLFQVQALAREGVTAEQMETALWNELLRIARDGISEADFERGKNQVIANNWSILEDNEGKASMLGFGVTLNEGDWTLVRDRLLDLDDITIDDVNRVARTYLTLERSNVVLGRGQTPPNSRMKARSVVAVTAGPELEARAKAGTPSEGKGQLVEAEAHGARLVTLYDPTIPMVDFQLAIPRGAATDPDGKEGRANLAAKMLLRGTEKRARQAFEVAVERLGGQVEVDVNADRTLITASAPSASWPQMAALLYEALAEPAFGKEELVDLKDEVDGELIAMLDDDFQLAYAAFQRTVYGPDHPYGRLTMGTRSSIKAITPTDVKRHHQQHLRAPGSLFVLSGDIDAAGMDDLKLLASALKGEPAAAPEWPEPAIASMVPAADDQEGDEETEEGDEEAPSQHPVVLVDKPDRSQSQILVGHLGVRGTEDDYPAFKIANHVFGGSGMTSRLWSEVREARGLSYGAGAYAPVRVHTGPYAMHSFPALDKTKQTATLMIDLSEKAIEGGISGQEFAQARESIEKKSVFLEERLADRVDLLVTDFLTGYDEREVVDKMGSVQLQDVNAAFQRVVSPDRMVVTVLGTAASVQEELESLGPVQVVSHRSLIE